MKGKLKPGFTLIELLVVIAVIALLLSILTPSLSAIKKKAAGAVCMTRQRSLILAGTLYSEDNDDFIISSCTNDTFPGSWVWTPDCVVSTGMDTWTIEVRKEGFRRGAMWPYIESAEFYHCPGDERIKQPLGSPAFAYRSYSMPSGLNSWYAHDPLFWAVEPSAGGSDHYCYTKMAKIKNPTNAMYFVEEAEKEAGYNAISWTVYVTVPMLWDPLSIYHSDSSTFGFVDGHSSIHKWRTEEMIEMFAEGRKWEMFSPENVDYIYLKDHFPYERIRED